MRSRCQDVVSLCSTANFWASSCQLLIPPSLRLLQFELTPVVTGVMFVISGTLYAVSAPLVGRLCDLNVYPKKVMVLGSVCIVTSYVLVGPLPGLPLPT